MATPNHYHTISLGSGEAGRCICWTLSSTLNVPTAVIESTYLCGSCPNIACLPSKNFVYSAEIAHLAKKYTATGLLKGDVKDVNMAAVLARKNEMVKGLTKMHEDIFEKSDTELIMGRGRLIGGGIIEIDLKSGGKRIVTADNIIICTGSRAKVDDTPGLKQAKPMTHIEIMDLHQVPEHLLILGGGYVGLEFAQAFRRFGAKVSVVERGGRILKIEDEDVSDALVEILKGEGVEFFTSFTVSSVTGISGRSVTLTGTRNGTAFELKGTHLLVASGRLPNTEDIGLEAAGVELTSTGHIAVNEYLQTSIPEIFAGGDCAGSPHFTHMGYDDFRIVADFLLNKKPFRSTKSRQVPYTLYTNPELAHVGLSENAARKTGVKYRLAKIPMANFLRTRAMDATHGFAKALVSATDDTVLGFTALGDRAGELLPVVQLAMSAGLPYTSISSLIVTHPTLNEGLVDLFSSVLEGS
ncbi:Dihydrolipoyl dehydrogenase [Ophiobolus disseminans]|uniref:Dihydrolipoyl dehydrogenase n=1 Tax=Ophiobolus disseminans TaxID=1469910 RepID=A0A6A6ZTG8_9PLEO|nr:Dihydrolipoyl dehydrogenase [Ophiobolus disseminans]